MCMILRMERDHLTTHQVANLVGVSLNTIYRWLKSEQIDEPYRDPTNNYRLWTASDVEKIRRLRAVEES